MNHHLTDNVRHMIYPVKLKPHVTELLVLKLHDLEEQFRREVEALNKVRDNANQCAVADLPEDDADLVREYLDAERFYLTVKKRFHEKFAHHYEGTVTRVVTEETRLAQAAARQTNYERANKDHKTRCAALVAVARKLAGEQVAAVRVKVSQGILDELDAIGKELA